VKQSAKAIALLSGGLDSTLATVVVRNLGVDVTAVTFLTPFGCNAEDRSSCSHNALPAARKYDFKLKMAHLGEKFIDIVRNPVHGHGKNMNPCIDCRILMLREAKDLMDMTGADFLVTGEVIGQRPMSQMRNTLRMIEKRAGVPDLVLRPLSARILPETLPERRGLIDRERLYGFHGRGRRPQMDLAAELGITDYPVPAGGCLLTDPIYSRKLANFLRLKPDLSPGDLPLLGVGRHFITPGGAWIIVGRNEKENNTLKGLIKEGDISLFAQGGGSPIVVVRYCSAEEDVETAAGICVRYSRHRRLPAVEVRCSDNTVLSVSAVSDELLESLRLY